MRTLFTAEHLAAPAGLPFVLFPAKTDTNNLALPIAWAMSNTTIAKCHPMAVLGRKRM
jgi:hypothetical protein